MNKILVFDNYDSFTYNLVHLVELITGTGVDVFRNDEIGLDQIGRYEKIILSPGPGIPDEAGLLKELIKQYGASKSILGVCLGHQAIAEVFGGKLLNLDSVYHGVATPVYVKKPDESLFKGLPENFSAGRYHSWIVDKDSLPDCFDLTAEDATGQIMGISHKQYDLKGVQFHPESVLTSYGREILANWLGIY
ncbi:MAG TPA: aminodeoxychorismate/anthranilate synthase component II [Bacteroidales bacterium]|nr:aminodeoxychorismate/anthranilate synthase component II [Bacteroidales bacterium]